MYCICTDELSITVGPLNQTVSEGGVATFTTTATGIKTREFEYEWFKVIEGDLIKVGMNKQLTINNVRIEDKGNYYCVVTNEWSKRKESTKVQFSVNGKMQDYGHVLYIQLHTLVTM